jgi:asparagine synthase (glutamine-hydrolysing)
MRSPFLDDDLVRLMYRAPRTEAKDVGPSLRLIEAGYPELAHMPTDRGVRQGGASAADRIRKAVLNFSAKAEYAYDYGMPRWLSRIDRVLTPLQPERLFLGRHKFYHFRIWYRRELAGYVRDTLLAPEARARAPYREGVLETMVREHTSGSANHTDEIHRALTHELVHQTLIAEAAHG